MRMIRRSERFEDLVKQLTTEKPHLAGGKAVFPTIRDLMSFAAVLGFEHGRKKPVDSKFIPIESRPFERSESTVDLIYLLALASEKNVEILRDEENERLVSIYEEFAQGGFEILEGWLLESPEDANGDRAIINALRKYDFLSVRNDSEVSMSDISFD
jgi:dnd system-associated protein 4